MNAPFRTLVYAQGLGRCRLARLAIATQIRRLSLHEYQTQELFRHAGIQVPRGRPVWSSSEVQDAVAEFGPGCRLKPQTLDSHHGSAMRSGARPSQALDGVSVEGSTASTPSTSLQDHKSQETPAYVEEAVVDAEDWSLDIKVDRERYQAILQLDRPSGQDSRGGPTRQIYALSALKGVDDATHTKIATQLGAVGGQKKELRRTIDKMYGLFFAKDAISLQSMLSLSRSSDSLWCSGGRLTVDDAASKRQEELFSQRDTGAEVPEELEAEKYSLVYVKLPGNIGTVVNGAGLAMATNDAIAHHGGASANFLDTGGQATVDTMTKAFSIILGDQRVKAILVNIYGGIIRCDMIAESIISTARSLGPLRVPLVVRLQGTNSEEGLRLLEEADLGMHIESDFGRAASRAVELAQESSSESAA